MTGKANCRVMYAVFTISDHDHAPYDQANNGTLVSTFGYIPLVYVSQVAKLFLYTCISAGAYHTATLGLRYGRTSIWKFFVRRR